MRRLSKLVCGLLLAVAAAGVFPRAIRASEPQSKAELKAKLHSYVDDELVLAVQASPAQINELLKAQAFKKVSHPSEIRDRTVFAGRMYMYYRVDATRVSPEQLAKFMGREAIVEVSRFPGARILVVGVRAP